MPAINIFFKSGQKFKFDLQLFSSLIHQSRDQLIAVYSVIGEKRARNEIFLNCFCNYLLENDESFRGKLSSYWTECDGSDEETAGIWMWSSPLHKVLTDGTVVAILQLNVKFCSKGNSQMQDNALVLTMTTLLSSVMIMNQNNIFNEDLLHFIRHSTVFARYELNDDQPFQKLILFFQEWCHLNQNSLEYKYGLHTKTDPDVENLNFRNHYLIPKENQSIKERFVRQSLLSTFEEVIVCLSEHRLEYNEKHIDVQLDCYPKGLYYPWKIVRNLCESDPIPVKTIDGKSITGTDLILKAHEWSEILECYVIPLKMSANLMFYHFKNQMALNSALDYYYYQMKEYLKDKKIFLPLNGPGYCNSNQETNSFGFLLKITGKSVELFESFQLLGGKAFEKRMTRSFWNNLNETQNYFNGQIIGKDAQVQITSLEDMLKRLESVEELKEKFNEMKSVSDDMKKDFDNKLKEVVADVADIKEELNQFRKLIKQKAEEENFERVLDGISNVAGDLLPNTKIWIKLFKFVYTSTMK